MDKKLLSIASLIFALVFVGIYILIWSNSQSVLKMQFRSIDSISQTEMPFDITLFDNRVVSGDSIKNIISELDSSPIPSRLKLFTGGSETEINVTSITELQYRTKLHYNANGAVDGLVVDPVAKT